MNNNYFSRRGNKYRSALSVHAQCFLFIQLTLLPTPKGEPARHPRIYN